MTRRLGLLGSIAAMSSREAVRIVLELDPGEPINGRIHSAAGIVETFRGWLELSTTIERMRTDHQHDRFTTDSTHLATDP